MQINIKLELKINIIYRIVYPLVASPIADAKTVAIHVTLCHFAELQRDQLQMAVLVTMPHQQSNSSIGKTWRLGRRPWQEGIGSGDAGIVCST